MDDRELLKKQLAFLLHRRSDVILYGPRGCGKTTLLSQVLSSESLTNISLSCSLIPTFPLILSHLSFNYGLTNSRSQLFSASVPAELKQKWRVIVFDKADGLMSGKGNLITLLTARTEMKLEAVFVFVCQGCMKDALRQPDVAALGYFPVPLLTPPLPFPVVLTVLSSQYPELHPDLPSFLSVVHPVLSAYSVSVHVYALAIRELFSEYQESGRDPAFQQSVKSFCERVFLPSLTDYTAVLDVPQKVMAVSAFLTANIYPRNDRAVFKNIPGKQAGKRDIAMKERPVATDRLLAVFDILYSSRFGAHFEDAGRLGADVGRLVEIGMLVPRGKRLPEKFESRVSIEEALALSENVGLRLSDYINSS